MIFCVTTDKGRIVTLAADRDQAAQRARMTGERIESVDGVPVIGRCKGCRKFAFTDETDSVLKPDGKSYCRDCVFVPESSA